MARHLHGHLFCGASQSVKSTLLDQGTDKQPGTVVAAGKEGIDVACGDGRLLRILELQAPGGKRMSAASYLAGHPIHL